MKWRGHTKLSTDIREINTKLSLDSPGEMFNKIVPELKRIIHVGYI